MIRVVVRDQNCTQTDIQIGEHVKHRLGGSRIDDGRLPFPSDKPKIIVAKRRDRCYFNATLLHIFLASFLINEGRDSERRDGSLPLRLPRVVLAGEQGITIIELKTLKKFFPRPINVTNTQTVQA
jgi:hypothetical protein